jgi:transmembrane sensor
MWRSRNMANLASPLKCELSEELSEATVMRMWNGIRARRASAPAVLWRSTLRFALAAALLGGVLACLLLALRPRSAQTDGPLRRADGEVVQKLGSSNAPSLTALSDGSRVELDASSELEVLDNTAQRFVTSLRRGRGTFNVIPGGKRRWTLEAGLASIEVVGTEFSVSRTPEAVEVRVERGVVLVRGERVPDRVQRLSAGDILRVTAAAPERSHAAPQSATRVEPSAASTGSTRVTSKPAAPSTTLDSFDDLMMRADLQRRAGDPNAAIATLRAALAEPQPNSRSALAAFTLGKLLLHHVGRPGEAADAFTRCLTLSPPAAVAEDALARLVEAHARAGRPALARVAAARYMSSYPNGHRRHDVEQWLSGL